MYEAVRCGEPGMPPGEERVGRNVESFEGRRTSGASGEEKSAQKVFQGPECLKMPQSMSESTRARASAARKSSVLRHP